MTVKTNMTAKQVARSVWEEMKKRHDKELGDMHRAHYADMIRVVSSQTAERDNIKKELGALLK